MQGLNKKYAFLLQAGVKRQTFFLALPNDFLLMKTFSKSEVKVVENMEFHWSEYSST